MLSFVVVVVVAVVKYWVVGMCDVLSMAMVGWVEEKEGEGEGGRGGTGVHGMEENLHSCPEGSSSYCQWRSGLCVKNLPFVSVHATQHSSLSL